MKSFEIFQKTVKEKNITDKDAIIIISAFFGSALTTAVEKQKLTKEDIEKINQLATLDNLKSLKSVEDVERFNSRVDQLLSKDSKSFLEEFNKAFDKLLTDFNAKAEKL